MCGIAGALTDAGPPPDERLLERMLGTLRHRGPDDEGHYLDTQIAFGARRLSIIDVAGGHQPLSNEDGSIWAAQNGEIYNYRELRSELEARGHHFKTHSDTETLVHLYEEHGDGFLTHLNGMFALALWDRPRRRLLLARDRLGIKPLYFASDAQGLVFGSEIKALLASGRVAPALDMEAARDYLQLFYVPTPQAILRGVSKLPPGHVLVHEAGRTALRRYWTLPAAGTDQAPLADQLERFTALFRDAVALQMRADVPYGAFLSGGIDSSAIVGTMVAHAQSPVRTFSIGFASASARYDELPFAREVARRFSTQHEEFVVQPQVFDLLGEMVEYFDEPFADAAFVPTYMLAGLSRQHVKVVLSGDGGDELFAGYDRYRSEVAAEWARQIPGWLRRGVLSPLLGLWPGPADWRASDWVRLARKKLDLLSLPPDERYVQHFHSWSPPDWAALQGPALRGLAPSQADARYLRVMAEAPGADFLNRRLALDIGTWLPDQMLTKVDRATMGRSLEARVPFLDHRVVEFAIGLPQSRKLAFGTLKRFLKQAFAELLPHHLLHRPKHGFEVPVDEWLRGPLRGLAREVLAPGELAAHGLVEPGFVARLLDEHESRTRNRSRELFGLLMFQMWHRRWMRA